MAQPIIDPDKVSAWAASVRGVFGGSTMSTLLVVGITLLFLGVVIGAAILENRQTGRLGK